MLYFAYGSNLDPEQMQFRCPGAKAVGLAALRDHRLAFPLYSNAWGGGVSSVQLAHGDTVWGMLFDLTEQHLQTLDGYEEFRGPGDQHNVYDRGQVTVELTRPDDGSFPRRVRAWTYIARPAKPSPPSRRYLDANNSYHYFESLGDLVITGPTNTNVMDVHLVLVGSGK